jgi:hypothetical protein
MRSVVKNRFHFVCFTALSIWFLLKGFYFCFHVPPGMPPDEMFHLQVTKLYAHSTRLFPFNDSWFTYARPLARFSIFASTTEYAYLFHFLMGAIVRFFQIDPFLWSYIPWLRLFNLGLACLTLRYSFLIWRALLPNQTSVLCAFAVITNLLMLDFLSAAVNYDNLLFVFCNAATYHCLKFILHLVSTPR